jgi:subtilase family serine protease
MRTRIYFLCLISLAFCSTSAHAQSSTPAITGAIIETQLVTLEGNTPGAALNAKNNRGPVADSMQLDHLLLALKRSPEAEARLAELIEAMHNPASPQYHQWLTPQQLGARFGVAPQDKETVQNWLISHGFTINHYYANVGVIDFSGNAGSVREAFHTELHHLVLSNGERHIANVRDPQIPAALAPAVLGVPSLHDFFPKAHSIRLGPVTFDHTTNAWHPIST